MKFNVDKVYTSLNADKVKIGSKGYYADTLNCLKDKVKNGYNGSIGTIDEIKDDLYKNRFNIKGDNAYCLFYLLDDPRVYGYHPYKNTDELIKDFKNQFYSTPQESSIPLIWIKNKNNQKFLIMSFDTNGVSFASGHIVHKISLSTLFKKYTYLDNTHCGIVERAKEE